MKMTAKPKAKHKAKPGDLLASHIHYGANGGASVRHDHEPEAPAKGQMYSPMPTPLEHNFSSRAEALHHVAQAAGVPSTLDDAEDAAEMAKGKKPSAKEEAAEGE